MNETMNRPGRTTAPLPPGRDVLFRRLPALFRVQSITRMPFDERHRLNRAVLFHEQASLCVEWLSRQVDVQLTVGRLVSVRWLGHPVSLNGAVRISRLVVLHRPVPDCNLFQTVLPGWQVDRSLLGRAAALWAQLPPEFGYLFNALLWPADRFYRYLSGPSSLNGHHAGPGGNLRHTVEVAEQVIDLAANQRRVHMGVLLVAALLHDVGKADEYEYVPHRQRMVLSDRGQLVGHKLTVLEWLAQARAMHGVPYDEKHYLALVNALTSAKGAPPWVGLREPQSAEAILLSAADRLSGCFDLIDRHAPKEPGFGRFHPHLGSRPFVVARSG